MSKVTKFQVRRNLIMAMGRIETLETTIKSMKSELQAAIELLDELDAE